MQFHSSAGQDRLHLFKRLSALTLALAVIVSILSLLSIRSAAVDEGVAMKNTYILTTSTGSSDGGNIQFFAVRYRDTAGLEQKHYILVCEDDLSKGSKGLPNGYEETQQAVKNLTGYTPASPSSTPALSTYRTCDFVFQTDAEIAQVLGIEIYTRGQGTWICQDMRVYRADRIYGERMYGYYSNQYYMDFSGVLLAEMERNDEGSSNESVTFNWDIDQCFTVSTDPQGDDDARLSTDFAEEEAVYDSHTQTGYYFEIGLDDSYGAGFESLVNYYSSGSPATLAAMNVYEPLALTLRYEDSYGNTRKVDLPVVTSAVSWAVSQGVDASTQLLGVAQQGDPLGFVGYLPDCKNVVEYTLTCGEAKARAVTKITPTLSTLRSQRISEQSDGKDGISMNYFAIYDLAADDVGVTVANGALYPSVSGQPAWYYQQASEPLDYGYDVRHSLSASDGKETLNYRDLTNSYLVVLNTDTMPNAATVSDLHILFQYVDLDGNPQSTSAYNVREYSQNYYGQWPGSDGDVAYRASMAAGGEACFVITLNDVNYFTGASFTLDSQGGDDWQMQSLKILRLTSLSRRAVEWTGHSGSGWSTDRTISRIYEGYETFGIDQNLLVQAGETKNAESASGSGGAGGAGGAGGSGGATITEKDVDWSQLRYSMSYEESTQDLGFTKIRRNYTVTVKVSSDAVTATKDGDCGSTNHFYFQLVFENGKSGYVLANQQLSSDRFRAGYDESFTISTT